MQTIEVEEFLKQRNLI